MAILQRFDQPFFLKEYAGRLRLLMPHYKNKSRNTPAAPALIENRHSKIDQVGTCGGQVETMFVNLFCEVKSVKYFVE